MRAMSESPEPKAKMVQISDSWTIRLIEAERLRRGDGTMAKTARSLIQERCAQIEDAAIPDETEAA